LADSAFYWESRLTTPVVKLNEFCRFVVNGPNDLPGASYGLESGIIFNRQPGTHFRSRFFNTVVWQDRVFVDFVF
jgi:hypothetical protein